MGCSFTEHNYATLEDDPFPNVHYKLAGCCFSEHIHAPENINPFKWDIPASLWVKSLHNYIVIFLLKALTLHSALLWRGIGLMIGWDDEKNYKVVFSASYTSLSFKTKPTTIFSKFVSCISSVFCIYWTLLYSVYRIAAFSSWKVVCSLNRRMIACCLSSCPRSTYCSQSVYIRCYFYLLAISTYKICT